MTSIGRFGIVLGCCWSVCGAYMPVASAEPSRAFLKTVRQKMVQRRSVPYSQLQALADSGDPLASFKLAKRLETMNRPELDIDIIHYHTQALNAGLDYAVHRLVSALKRIGPGASQPRLEAAERVLVARARRGNEKAAKALFDFYTKGAPFGIDQAALREVSAMLTDTDDPELALKFAMELSQSAPLSEQEKQRALGYLDIAAKSESLGTRTTAENLLRLLDVPAVLPDRSPPDE